jgi:hypothetical protein
MAGWVDGDRMLTHTMSPHNETITPPPKRSLQKGGANEPVVRIQLVKDAGKDDATETIAIDVPTRLGSIWD